MALQVSNLYNFVRYLFKLLMRMLGRRCQGRGSGRCSDRTNFLGLTFLSLPWQVLLYRATSLLFPYFSCLVFNFVNLDLNYIRGRCSAFRQGPTSLACSALQDAGALMGSNFLVFTKVRELWLLIDPLVFFLLYGAKCHVQFKYMYDWWS